ERYADHWTPFLPETFAVRAHLCKLLADKHLLLARATPGVLAALGVQLDQVASAYFQLFGQPIETILGSQESGPEAKLPAEDQIPIATESELEWKVLPGGEVLFR